MTSSSVHLAAVLLLLGGAKESQAYGRSRRHGSFGGGGFNRWPASFMSTDLDHSSTGAFRPFHHPRGGGIFTTGSPLVDIFQDVVGDISKVARELTEPRTDGSTRVPRHEVVDGQEAVTLSVDLPGCKKQDVDAQISEDAGEKTLRITAVRKRRRPRTDTAEKPATEEASHDNFELAFRVGDAVDVEGVRGRLEDGVLTLVLPKVAPQPPAQPIEVPIDPPMERAAGAPARAQDSEEAPTPEQGRSEGSANEDSRANTHISLS